MRSALPPILLVAALIAVRLSAPIDLMSGDQGKSAQYVLHAWQTGELLVPLEKGHILPTKPPLPTWISLLSCRIAGGVSELAVRLPSSILAILLALLTWLIARRLVPDPIPAIAVLVLAANYVFLKTSVLVRPDMALAVTVAGSVWCALRALQTGGRGWGYGCFLLLGLGVLAKGPVAPLLAALAVVPWVVLRGEGRTLRRLPLLPGTILFLGVVSAWAVPAYLQRGPALAKLMIVDELSRHAGGGRQPVYSYLFTFPGRFLPWILFLPFGIVAAWRARRASGEWPLGLPFCWFAFGFLALSLVGSKRADYLLPLLPAAAILVAGELVRSRRLTPILIAVVGGGLVLGLAAAVVLGPDGVASLIPKGRPKLVTLAALLAERFPIVVGGLAAGAGLAALGLLSHYRRRPALAALALFAVFLLGTVVTFHVFPDLDAEFSTTPDFAARALEQSRERDLPLLVHGIRSGGNGLLFYLGKAEPMAAEESVVRSAVEHGEVLVVTTPDGERQLSSRGLRTTSLDQAEQIPGKLTWRLVLARPAP
jgi:4-amino-4-deoxy-L-arabinose transferase-like glycosyltransferase